MNNSKNHVTLSQGNLNNTRWALRLNALSCFVFGILFVLYASDVGKFLGSFPQLWLVIIGVALLFHTAHLVWASIRTTVYRFEIYYFSAGDFLWFLGSLLVLTGTNLITTSHGVLATLAVAIVVSMLGITQVWTYSTSVRAQQALSSN